MNNNTPMYRSALNDERRYALLLEAEREVLLALLDASAYVYTDLDMTRDLDFKECVHCGAYVNSSALYEVQHTDACDYVAAKKALRPRL